jgi:Oxidoreductase family, C-terminal alpha/beta domain/Oxidoreductase family, NAD-binding Rossmann fold
MKAVSRRGFLASAAAPMIVPASILGLRAGTVPPSDRITFGGIGIGSRGNSSVACILSYQDARFLAVADVRKERRDAVKATVDKRYQSKDCATYTTHEELLARTDIDGVLIATGDRWHTPMSILAAKAGKDVYCEKPCSMTIAESQALPEAFRRYGRIYQAGCQRRNGKNFVWAVNLAREGKLGKLQTLHANAGTAKSWEPMTIHDWMDPEPEPPKDEVDWDRWLGPSPWRPYHSSYVKGKWRGYFDFHGGGILEWGSHTADICHWAGDLDHTQPVEYEPAGQNKGPYFVYTKFANGVKLVLRDDGWMGLGTCSVRFEGDQGWVETGDTGKIAVSDNLKAMLPPADDGNAFNLALHWHWRDYIESIKTRSQPRAHAGTAANTHITCHAAYIAWQLGRKLTWDPAKQEFPGDAEANRMRSREMREPWRI